MQKIFKSLLYLLLHPLRVLEIFHLYKKLKGKYRYKIILAHSYREAFYSKKMVVEDTINSVKNLSEQDFLNNRQVIISIHDGLLHSGGLTDRLKGICTLYRFAKKQNIKFKICFISPFNLEKYLLPNEYDWTIMKSAISYDLKTTAIYTWEDEKLVGDFFHYNKNKLQLHISCNSGECFYNYSELFHELFKTTPFLNTKIKSHLEKLGGEGNYISVSFRFQNLLGEFEEANSVSLNKEMRNLLINKCLKTISDLKERYPTFEKILITSDSNIFREISTTKYSYIYTYILPEEIGHIDYAKAGTGKELTAFLDMFLISRAKKAYQVRSTEMYNSDFPNMAAKINDVPYEMILID